MLNLAGGASTGIETAVVYRLKPGSPCIDAGTAITNNGGKDFWGTSVPYNNKTEIGVYEGPGTTSNKTIQSMKKLHSGSFANIVSSKNGGLQVKMLVNDRYTIEVFTVAGKRIAHRTGYGMDHVDLLGNFSNEMLLVTVCSGNQLISRMVMVVR